MKTLDLPYGLTMTKGDAATTYAQLEASLLKDGRLLPFQIDKSRAIVSGYYLSCNPSISLYPPLFNTLAAASELA